MTVRKAKEKANEIDKIWTYNDDILNDDRTLSVYDISDGSQILSMGMFLSGGILNKYI